MSDRTLVVLPWVVVIFHFFDSASENVSLAGEGMDTGGKTPHPVAPHHLHLWDRV